MRMIERDIKLVLWLVGFLLLAGCKGNVVSPWADADAWYQTGDEANAEYADVLYFVSTDVFQSVDAEGNRSYRAVLTEEERALMAREMAYIHENIYSDSLNYFAPYYHQMTFEAISLPLEESKPIVEVTEAECMEAFNYYMAHLNEGRPFILAGFSQGAQMVKTLLKRMTDEQYAQMVAAYVIGYELTAEDVESPHIIPAQNATDRGVTISFNSVCSVESVWPVVYSKPVACINPVNWCTDATPAPLQAGDVTLSVAVDPTYEVVVVTGYGDNPPKARFEEPWPKGNLHHQEIKIYAASLGRNALDRAYGR